MSAHVKYILTLPLMLDDKDAIGLSGTSQDPLIVRTNNLQDRGREPLIDYITELNDTYHELLLVDDCSDAVTTDTALRALGDNNLKVDLHVVTTHPLTNLADNLVAKHPSFGEFDKADYDKATENILRVEEVCVQNTNVIELVIHYRQAVQRRVTMMAK